VNEAFSGLLDTGHLFDPSPGPPSLYYGIIGFFFAVIFGASLSAYLRRNKLPPGAPAVLKLVTRALIVGMVLGAVGVILVVARFFAVPYLSMRILIYLWILITLGLLGYAVYYVRRVYPKQKTIRQQAYMRARYMPKPAPKPSGRKKKAKRRR